MPQNGPVSHAPTPHAVGAAPRTPLPTPHCTVHMRISTDPWYSGLGSAHMPQSTRHSPPVSRHVAQTGRRRHIRWVYYQFLRPGASSMNHTPQSLHRVPCARGSGHGPWRRMQGLHPRPAVHRSQDSRHSSASVRHTPQAGLEERAHVPHFSYHGPGRVL